MDQERDVPEQQALAENNRGDRKVARGFEFLGFKIQRGKGNFRNLHNPGLRPIECYAELFAGLATVAWRKQRGSGDREARQSASATQPDLDSGGREIYLGAMSGSRALGGVVEPVACSVGIKRACPDTLLAALASTPMLLSALS